MSLYVDSTVCWWGHHPLPLILGLFHWYVVIGGLNRENRTRHGHVSLGLVLHGRVVQIVGLDALENRAIDLHLVITNRFLWHILVGAATLAIDRSHQLFELVGVHDEVPEVVVLLDVVDGAAEVLQLLGVNHQLLEVMVAIDVVDGTLNHEVYLSIL